MLCFCIQASTFGSSKEQSSSSTGASTGGTQGTVSSTTDQSSSGSFQSPHQPVEFNHAINYVNKIKVSKFFELKHDCHNVKFVAN